VRAPARAAQFAWKCADVPTPDFPLNVRLTQAFARIRAETNGELDIKLFPNGLLGSDAATVAQMRLGALEMMTTTGGVLDSFVPVGSIENVPFAFHDTATVFRAFDGDLGKVMRAEFMAKGIYTLERIYYNGFRQFTTSNKPIRNIDDLQGLRLKVSAANFRVDTWRSLGASPTVIPEDTYIALQTHLVDGEETPLPFIEASRYYEVQKYCSISNHMWTAFWVFFNHEKWESLPRHFQDIAQKHINAYALIQRRDNERLELILRDKLTRQGMIFNAVDVSGFKARLGSSGFYNRWRNTFGATAWSALEKYSGPLG
jgi:TRAP-type transport system periplasmic protein